MATVQLKFGSLAFDSTNNITISGISEKSGKPVQVANIPLADGGIAETARLKEKLITIEGDIAGTSYDNLRTNLDALQSGLDMMGIQALTKDNERYINCQFKDFSHGYDHLTRRATWSAQFVAHFPFWLAVTATTDTRTPTSAVTFNITNSGNAPARVKVQVTAPAGTGINNHQAEVVTGAQLYRYRGNVNKNNILVVDNRVVSDDFVVTNNAVSDFPNFEGDFLVLSSGNNTIRLTGTQGSTVLTWRNTWYHG